MTNPAIVSSTSSIILSAEDWLKADFRVKESEVLVGSIDNPLVRPQTKNLIQAPEKAFKTTFLLRLALGISTGETVFSSLPIKTARKVLYLHGELAPPELKERLQEAANGLGRPLDNFFQGRTLDANLITADGQRTIFDLGKEHQPDVLVLDPWQSFIAGADENSFKEVSVATSFMDRLIADSEVTIFMAIHLGKDHSRGARGHSTLAGWRDTLFTLKRNNNTLNVKVEPRWASPPDDLKLTFQDGTLWEGDGPAWTKQAEEIRKLLLANGGKLFRKALAFGLHLDDSALRMALKRAQARGAIQVDGDVVTITPSLPTSPNHPL